MGKEGANTVAHPGKHFGGCGTTTVAPGQGEV